MAIRAPDGAKKVQNIYSNVDPFSPFPWWYTEYLQVGQWGLQRVSSAFAGEPFHYKWHLTPPDKIGGIPDIPWSA